MRKVKITQEQYSRLFKVNLTESDKSKNLSEGDINGVEKQNIDEDIFTPEVHQAVSQLIHNIWLNPSQEGLDPFFRHNGVTWGDIITYLTGVGIIGTATNGAYKLLNFFNTADF